MNILRTLYNFFLSKENIYNNLKASKIMIDKNNFNNENLTLGNTFKVNENIKIKSFKDKILKDHLTIVVINNKGKTIGYITKNELFKKY